MSTLNMLAEQAPFGRSEAGPVPFTTANNFAGDFLGLSLPEEDHLWGLSPLSPPLQSWNGKPDQEFANPPPHLERDLKNTHVRNGQPTPPPYDDKKLAPHHPADLYSLAQCQLDGAGPDFPMSSDHQQANSYHQHRRATFAGLSGTGNNGSHQGAAKRRRFKSIPDDFDDDDEDHPDRAKREKFLERNRVAASKCRQKKKEHTMRLESRYKEQSNKKEQLVSELARLRSELLGLKNEVLKHAQCGDEPIKMHLAQMVKKITYNDAAPELTDMPDAASSSEGPVTPTAQQPLSFGFDDPLQLESSIGAGAVDPQMRRESEASLMSEPPYTFATEDSFDDLINV